MTNDKELAPQRDGELMRVIVPQPRHEIAVVIDIISRAREADDSLQFGEIRILVPTPKVAAGYVQAIRERSWPAAT